MSWRHWVLYSAESLVAGTTLTGAWALALWLTGQPWWVWPPASLVGGFLACLCRELSPLSLVTTWHGAIQRRIEER